MESFKMLCLYQAPKNGHCHVFIVIAVNMDLVVNLFYIYHFRAIDRTNASFVVFFLQMKLRLCNQIVY